MSAPTPATTEQDQARIRAAVHTREPDAPEDRNIMTVWTPTYELIYSEILAPEQKFDPPQWVVWGIRYRGWNVERKRYGRNRDDEDTE